MASTTAAIPLSKFAGVSTNITWIDAAIHAITTFDSPADYFYFSLLLSLPFAILAAFQRREDQKEEEKDDEVLQIICQAAWQEAKGFKKLFGLVECWSRGEIQWGPWDAESIQYRWPDWTYMRRFCRAGMVPFHIERGGAQTYQKSYFNASGWNVELPVYVRSKGRAFFEFLVLFPNGYAHDPIPARDKSRRIFLQNLVKQRGYAVTISYWHLGKSHRETNYSPLLTTTDPFEVGAESRFKFLLPFKRDQILQPGKGMGKIPLTDFVSEYERFVPLLTRWPCAIVRVEALDYAPHRLDEFVFRKMREANVVDIWIEDELARSVGRLFSRLGVDFSIDHELS